MSDRISERNGLYVTSFAGGPSRGLCLAFDTAHSVAELTALDVAALVDDLTKWLDHTPYHRPASRRRGHPMKTVEPFKWNIKRIPAEEFESLKARTTLYVRNGETFRFDPGPGQQYSVWIQYVDEPALEHWQRDSVDRYIPEPTT
jgi:hypothetical protein